jgi:hypothetical protein
MSWRTALGALCLLAAQSQAQVSSGGGNPEPTVIEVDDQDLTISDEQPLFPDQVPVNGGNTLTNDTIINVYGGSLIILTTIQGSGAWGTPGAHGNILTGALPAGGGDGKRGYNLELHTYASRHLSTVVPTDIIVAAGSATEYGGVNLVGGGGGNGGAGDDGGYIDLICTYRSAQNGARGGNGGRGGNLTIDSARRVRTSAGQLDCSGGRGGDAGGSGGYHYWTYPIQNRAGSSDHDGNSSFPGNGGNGGTIIIRQNGVGSDSDYPDFMLGVPPRSDGGDGGHGGSGGTGGTDNGNAGPGGGGGAGGSITVTSTTDPANNNPPTYSGAMARGGVGGEGGVGGSPGPWSCGGCGCDGQANCLSGAGKPGGQGGPGGAGGTVSITLSSTATATFPSSYFDVSGGRGGTAGGSGSSGASPTCPDGGCTGPYAAPIATPGRAGGVGGAITISATNAWMTECLLVAEGGVGGAGGMGGSATDCGVACPQRPTGRQGGAGGSGGAGGRVTMNTTQVQARQNTVDVCGGGGGQGADGMFPRGLLGLGGGHGGVGTATVNGTIILIDPNLPAFPAGQCAGNGDNGHTAGDCSP